MIDATLGDDADGFQRLTQRLLSALDDRDHASWPHPHLYRQLALARHHGLPTRLLDWSRSPRVAAYFAAVAAAKAEEADAPDKKWISVWGISRYARGACSDDNSFRSGIESIQVPNAGNVNLFAQWGQFTTMRVNPRAFDRPIDRRPVDELVQHRAGSLSEAGESAPVPLMYRVRAPRSETMEILWRLSREGIMRHRLFPEFGSVVASLREDWYHWRPNLRGR